MRAFVLSLIASVFAVSAAYAEPCVVRGEVDYVVLEVTPEGAPPISFSLVERDAVAVPGTDRERTTVRVETGLAFTGSARSVPYVFRAPTKLANGMLRVNRTTVPAAVRAQGDDVVSDLELAHGIVALDVTVPCRALALGATPRAQVQSTVPSGRGQTYFVPREDTFEIFAQPGDASGLRITARQRISLPRSTPRDGWVRVRWTSFRGGASIQGFLPIAVLDVAEPTAYGVGTGFGAPPMFHRYGTSREPGLYIGLATLDAGTQVTANRGVGVWATAIAGERVVVRRDARNEWAEVLAVPGVIENGGSCGADLCHAFVPRDAVHPIP